MLLDNQVSIFEEFLRDFNVGFTGSSISKKKRLNQKTTSNFLKKLEEKTILKSKLQGKNKLYFLNLENKEIVKNFIISVEHLRTIRFYEKHILVSEVVEKILPFIQNIGVIFGSYAKWLEKKGSDLDIFIVGKCNEKEIEKISKQYKLEISLKIYPKFELDLLTREVIKDHIAIKGVELFFGEIINEQNKVVFEY